MKVALLHPGIVLEGFAKNGMRPKTGSLNHGLCYISSALKADGHDVRLIDLRQLSGWEELPGIVKKMAPDIVGITIMSLDYDAAVKSAKIIKNVDRKIKVIAGGVHATLVTHELMNNDDIDYIFKGEAEVTLPRILEDLAAGSIKEKVITGEKPDLDKIPFMDRTLYKILQLPMAPYLKMPFISTMSARGCTYNCNFCQPAERLMFGGKVRRMSVERFIEELRTIRSGTGFNSFMIHDDCLLEDIPWVEKFLKLYSKEGFKKPFICQSRVDIIVRHPKMLRDMANHGLEMLGIGFESGSQRILNFLRKGTTVEQNYEAAKICKRYGIRIFANFMLGIPTETKEDVRKTVDMIKRIKPYAASPSFYTPSPGSDLHDYCVKNDLSLITKHEDYLRSPEGAKIKGHDYEFLKIASAETLKVPYSVKLRRKIDKLKLRHFNKNLINNYLFILLAVLSIALSGCGKVSDSKIEDFANMYIEKFKENNLVGMYNMFHEKANIIYPRFEAAHKDILNKLGAIKEIKKGRTAGYDRNFGGNTYEIIYDIEFEKNEAIYSVKVFNGKKELYMLGWYVQPKNTVDNAKTGQKEQIAISGSLNSYPDLPYKELIFPINQFPASHAPSITELPGGGLFAVWYAAAPWGTDTAIWGSIRPIGAREWSAPSLICDTPGLSDKNPMVYAGDDKKLRLFWVVEKSQSKLWLFWFIGKNQSKWRELKVRAVESGDSGRTWTEARDLGVPSGFMTRAHPIKLHNGQIVLPLYMDWGTSSAIVTSGDGGLTWSRPKYILYVLGIQPTVIQRSDLSLFALMRSGVWPRQCWQAVSNDLGNSWKNQRISGIKNPGSAVEMVKLRNGHVALAFNNSKTNRSKLSLALSYDDGVTWPYIKVIEDKAGYFYPSIIQDRLGLIHVVYSYNEQNGIAHFVTDEQWIKT